MGRESLYEWTRLQLIQGAFLAHFPSRFTVI